MDWTTANAPFSPAVNRLIAYSGFDAADLLAAPEAEVTGVERHARAEYELNRETASEVLIMGFGTSDFRASCCSHLEFMEKSSHG